ncbi:cell wall integrity and stress response component 2-like [Bradysia coprophila]|uniref:cell wall integrity and stress response component 2-like n=1 Tax=Bradysia coprophila TaxID=38358 RepID=UPI00187D9350|nr:cell wall integrity and stress response component 2-like [Bradysia coprophila]
MIATFKIGILAFFLLCIDRQAQAQIETACAGSLNGTFVRNSESCRAFYYCSEGIAHRSVCPDNYVFEPVRQMCDIPSRVDCTGCSLSGIQHIAHPTDCSKYYVCVAGVRTLRTCGANLLFDRSLGDCNVATTVKCVRDPATVCATYNGFVRIGDPSDCTKFFTCLNGLSYHQTCASGLYFNPETTACTLPGQYNFCQEDGTIYFTTSSTTTTTTTRAATTTTTRATTTTTRATTTTTRATTTTTATTKVTTTTTTRQPWTQPNAATTPFSLSDIDTLCTGQVDGYYSVPGTCQDYVFCLRSTALHFKCDSPWFWNQIKEECSTVVPFGC